MKFLPLEICRNASTCAGCGVDILGHVSVYGIYFRERAILLQIAYVLLTIVQPMGNTKQLEP